MKNLLEGSMNRSVATEDSRGLTPYIQAEDSRKDERNKDNFDEELSKGEQATLIDSLLCSGTF